MTSDRELKLSPSLEMKSANPEGTLSSRDQTPRDEDVAGVDQKSDRFSESKSSIVSLKDKESMPPDVEKNNSHCRDNGVLEKANPTDAEHDLEQTQSDNQDENLSEPAQDLSPGSWNNPRQNIFRLIAINYGFIVFGMNDSSIGVLLPALEKYYDINYLVASIAFIAPFLGFLTAAIASDTMHRKIGRWGCAMLGTSCQMICYIICVFAPPFPVFVIAYAISGLGSGTLDAAWNSWAGTLKNSNHILGFLHAFYGLGGIMCPSIFTAMMDAGKTWNICYAVMIGMSALSVTLSTIFWWGDSPRLYLKELQAPSVDGKQQASIGVTLRHKLVWSLAVILFLYVGVEVVLGGWITTFMIVVRHGSESKMGYVTTGFWTGLTVGRVALGFVTELFVGREEYCLVLYLSGAVALMIVFWVVDVLVVSAISVALIGFFIGPAFPIMVVVAVRKLPKWLHVAGVGFAASFGGGGAAVLPFVNGIISQTKGPRVLGPYAFSLLAAITIGWVLVVKFF